MKILNIILKVLLCLLFITPILGALGVFPEPKPEYYNTPEAYEFIMALVKAKYIPYIIAIVFAVALVLIITNRMAAAALLITPVTVNIICFHLFMDGGLLTAGAVMANMLALLNVYFLWQNRTTYNALLKTITTTNFRERTEVLA